MLLFSFPLALAFAATLTVNGCGQSAPSSSPPSRDPLMAADSQSFTVLLSANTSGFDEGTELVLRDEKAFTTAWRTAHQTIPGNPAPTVDFQRDMVVLLALGARRTGGFSVRFDGITSADSGAVVRYTVTSPGPGCMTTQMITSPVEMVRVPRAEGTVRFERRDATDAC